jgi:heme exporter protein D
MLAPLAKVNVQSISARKAQLQDAANREARRDAMKRRQAMSLR